MGGRRAQSSEHNCPRTEVMRTAAVQGGSPDTLTCPRRFRHTLYLQCKSFPYTHMHSALPLQHKDTLLRQLSRTTAPCMALLPSVPFSLDTVLGFCFCYSVHLTKGLSIFCLPQQERMEPKDLQS